MEKFRVGQAKDNLAHAHCMFDAKGYKYPLRIRNTYCFSTTKMVARTRLHVTLYMMPVLLMDTAVYLSQEEKRYELEADHTPPSSADVKNSWSYTFTSPYNS